MNKSHLAAVLMLSGSMLLACQQKQGQAVSDVAVPDLVVKPINATAPAKPGAQVSLVSDTRLVLTAGQLAPVDIVLSAQVGDGTLTVELSPGEGVQLSGAKNSYEFTRSEDGRYRIKAELYAANDGRYYLNVNSTVKTGDASSFRSLAIIVQVGEPTAVDPSSSGIEKKTSEADVISLPAQEQIINQ